MQQAQPDQFDQPPNYNSLDHKIGQAWYSNPNDKKVNPSLTLPVRLIMQQS